VGVLADVATDLGLDAEGLRSALASGRYSERHDKALLRARELDITSVPTFLVGDRRLEGMPTAEGLRRLLDG
jgi:predicted DsbA family dithiol-disulfide isomerase